MHSSLNFWHVPHLGRCSSHFCFLLRQVSQAWKGGGASDRLPRCRMRCGAAAWIYRQECAKEGEKKGEEEDERGPTWAAMAPRSFLRLAEEEEEVAEGPEVET